MTYKQQYMKDRRRIQRFIRSATKRGYTFNFELPAIPKKITKASVSRLKKITSEELYKKATYKTPKGKVVSGRKGRQLERKAAAQKAKKTRKHKQEKAKFKEKVQTAVTLITSGEIAVQRLEEMIADAYEMGHTESAKLVEVVLKKELATLTNTFIDSGLDQATATQKARDTLGFSMENAPDDWVEAAYVTLTYKMHTEIWQRAYTTLINIITGVVPTSEELMYYQDIIEGDTDWNYEE